MIKSNNPQPWFQHRTLLNSLDLLGQLDTQSTEIAPSVKIKYIQKLEIRFLDLLDSHPSISNDLNMKKFKYPMLKYPRFK